MVKWLVLHRHIYEVAGSILISEVLRGFVSPPVLTIIAYKPRPLPTKFLSLTLDPTQAMKLMVVVK